MPDPTLAPLAPEQAAQAGLPVGGASAGPAAARQVPGTAWIDFSGRQASA